MDNRIVRKREDQEYDVVSREELQAVKAQVLPLLLEVAGLQEEMPEAQG